MYRYLVLLMPLLLCSSCSAPVTDASDPLQGSQTMLVRIDSITDPYVQVVDLIDPRYAEYCETYQFYAADLPDIGLCDDDILEITYTGEVVQNLLPTIEVLSWKKASLPEEVEPDSREEMVYSPASICVNYGEQEGKITYDTCTWTYLMHPATDTWAMTHACFGARFDNSELLRFSKTTDQTVFLTSSVPPDQITAYIKKESDPDSMRSAMRNLSVKDGQITLPDWEDGYAVELVVSWDDNPMEPKYPSRGTANYYFVISNQS